MSEQESTAKTAKVSQSASSDLLGRIIGDGTVVEVGGDTMWPKISNGNDIEWVMRYGEGKVILEKRYYVAQIIASYKALINMQQADRNKICKAIQKAT
ncbi:MAG: hypothetical protein GY718_19615 [Lentisphaerae bacterium]|nr:hypothetical protein [Lentisphaerota bacterium]